MWKWIVGLLVLALVLLGGTCYWGFRKFTKGGNVAQVTIKGTPEHLFQMLTDPDSLLTWSSAIVQSGRTTTGPLQVGDTLSSKMAVGTSIGGPASVKQERNVDRWVIRQIQAPSLVVMEGLMPPDSAGHSRVMFARRDSLVAMGDSTTLYSSFTSPVIADAKQAVKDSGGSVAANSTMGALEKIMSSGLRMMMESDQQRLKAHIEKP